MREGSAYATRVWCRMAFQFQGSNSCTRACGNSAPQRVHDGTSPCVRTQKSALLHPTPSNASALSTDAAATARSPRARRLCCKFGPEW